jgi:conjugal transfer pilus assembly protein TraW
MKRLGKKAFVLLLLAAGGLEGKNFEIRGTVFPISEENFADFLSRQVQELPSRELVRRQEESRLQLVRQASNPPPAPHIQEAAEYRFFLFNPSYIAKEEIKDGKGNIVVWKGAFVNPLERISLSSGLLFFDGENKQHIEWAKKQMGNFKWVLTKGVPTVLEQKERRPVYFDQGGRYALRFQIQRVPARVTQHGVSLWIEEVPVEMQELKNSEINIPSSQTVIGEEAEERKCSTKAWVQPLSDEPGIFIFISFSVPVESWKDLSEELDKAGGVFVLKGIPNHSFLEFAAKVEELRNNGVNAPIQIDPLSFEKYGIEHVPAIVLDDGRTFDKIYGNVRLNAALDLIAQYGTVSRFSKKMLSRINDRGIAGREQ